jgi:flagellar hook protein FlgE
MSGLYGALSSSVSGLEARSTHMAMISDNIANLNTAGFKEATPHFATLVTGSGSSSAGYSSGGITVVNAAGIDQQGLIQGTGISTDLGVSGNGMIPVNSKADGSGQLLFTRAGAFRQNVSGNFVNTGGYALLGWPVDGQGRLPGQPGNLNTTSMALTESLVPVTVNGISSNASPTTSVKLKLNLDATQAAFRGPGDTIAIPSSATANYNISSTDVLAYDNAGANIFNPGDKITLTPATPGSTYTFTYGGVMRSADITTNVLGASTSSATFSGATAGWQFEIVNGGSTYTYTYTPTSPVPSSGQFNNLSTLAQAINSTPGLTARVDPAGKYIFAAAKDATQSITFTDVGASTFVANLFGGAGAPATVTVAGAANQFSNLAGLADLINASNGLGATIESPGLNPTLAFYSNNPLGNIIVDAATGGSVLAGAASTATSILSELGLSTTAPRTIGQTYDPAGVAASNMSSGLVTAQYNTATRVYDSLGEPHDLQINFLKTNTNTWAVEVTSLKSADLVSGNALIASGNLVFNGDGTLASVSPGLTTPVTLQWTDLSLPSTITFNWGTAGAVSGTAGATVIGLKDGVRQVAAKSDTDMISQDGAGAGNLKNINIDDAGNVIAIFSNGTSKKVYQIPLVNFQNVNGLTNAGNNAYAVSQESGVAILEAANTGSAGAFVPGALENSNADLSDQLTSMIIAQRGYQSSSQVIKAVNDMLEALSRVV